MATNLREIERNIKELQRWLKDHKPSDSWTAGQKQSYNDRLSALGIWIAKAQQAYSDQIRNVLCGTTK